MIIEATIPIINPMNALNPFLIVHPAMKYVAHAKNEMHENPIFPYGGKKPCMHWSII